MAYLPVYLPLAETTVDLPVLAGIGAGVGFLSGLFGVGGGFLITPLLIFLGLPPAIAAATGANTVIASSASGAMAHWRRGTLDVRMGLLLLAGGLAGSLASVRLFGLLRDLGQLDLAISLAYVALLGGVGTAMLVEGIRAAAGSARKAEKSKRAPIGAAWPWRLRFERSGIETSALAPLGLGFAVGVLTGLMGVGGGFLLVPAMIYLLAMPTATVIGTSLFQIAFVAASTTFLQAWTNRSVDVVLAAVLILGGAFAAPFGARAGAKLGAARLRALLALLVLAVAVVLAVGLIETPDDIYSIRFELKPTEGNTP